MLIYGIGFFFDSAGGCRDLEYEKNRIETYSE